MYIEPPGCPLNACRRAPERRFLLKQNMQLGRISASSASFSMKPLESSFGEGSTADEVEPLRCSGAFDRYEATQHVRRNSSAKLITFTRIYVLLLHLLVFGLAAALWRPTMIIDAVSPAPTGGRSWSPVHQFLEYEVKDEHAIGHSRRGKYSGPPTAAQHEAWDDLMRPVYFKEFERARESFEDAVEVTDGGYLALLAVYHELHCIRQLRLYLYKDGKYANLTGSEDDYIQPHLDHCLETLRLTVMCQGNSSLYSFAWEDQAAGVSELKSNSRSVCVKWSALEEWAHSRRISDVPSLSRPQQ
jgi:hypothetical protein